MAQTAIVTDSNSGITQKKAEELGIFVVPMPFFINGDIFFEDISLTQEQFYQQLSDGADVSTSQPSPGDVMGLWKKILEDNDEICYIPMSSALSASCEVAKALSMDFDGKVHVVDNKRISVTLKQSVFDAIALRESGKTAAQIKKILEKEANESSIYLAVDSLKYLKKGGRITPAAAAIGTVLNIKPVLTIPGGKIDVLTKTRGTKAAKKVILEAIEKDLQNKFAGKNVVLRSAYSGKREESLSWFKECADRFPEFEIEDDCLSLSVACHTGPGVVALTVTKIVDII
ncbi:MAG: DegV family protein [Lachnospiraceae bacterium]|jgi:DegV family protein with EDD domain|nr:DegV family protein [Lachnospiraceae bacterium]